MSDEERIEALRAKHSELENALESEIGRPHPDQELVSSIKKQKLRVKDELAQISPH